LEKIFSFNEFFIKLRKNEFNDTLKIFISEKTGFEPIRGKGVEGVFIQIAFRTFEVAEALVIIWVYNVMLFVIAFYLKINSNSNKKIFKK